MTTVQRIRVPWSGGGGGAGLSTFYAADAAAAILPLYTFFNSIKTLVPTGISWSFVASGDTLVVETGVLSGAWMGTGQANVVASGPTASMANPVGAMVKWSTGAVLFGHRVVGRTFIVPSVSTSYTSGLVNAATIATLGNAAAALIAAVSGNMKVWTRPQPALPAWTDVHGRVHPPKAAHDGALTPITSASVPTLAVVLRSRRD